MTMTTTSHVRRSAASGDEGFTLIEVMVALMLCMVLAAGLLSMDVVATKMTENEGHLSSRATEYAQDKLEQLMVLAYGNTSSNTTVFPATNTGGTGLALGGSADPAGPVDGYADYLSQTGNLLVAPGGTPPANWYYQRVWSVTDAGTNLKQITVTVAIRSGFAAGRQQRSTVSALKSFPF